jgi:hypothetical protein
LENYKEILLNAALNKGATVGELLGITYPDETIWNKEEVKEINMDNLEKAKKIIKEHYSDACCGLFNTRNFVGDPMETIYINNGLMIDICYGYAYFEVFGLTDKEFKELCEYYRELGNGD